MSTLEQRYRMGQGAWPYDSTPAPRDTRPRCPWLAVAAWFCAALAVGALIAVGVA